MWWSFTTATLVITLLDLTPAHAADGIDWVRIKGGTFVMGTDEKPGKNTEEDDGPAHRVTVKTFDISRTLVTNAQYKACVDADACLPAHYLDGRCRFKEIAPNFPKGFTGADQPVICLDWDQAHEFAKWACARLPTEAEWEYAARSRGKDRAYPWGNQAATCDRAVVTDEMFKPCCGRSATWPVCSKPKGNTEQGLCDMAGNVGQWIEDDWSTHYYNAPRDGSAAKSTISGGPIHMSRGGACYLPGTFARSTHRSTVGGEAYDTSYGLRLARDVTEDK